MLLCFRVIITIDLLIRFQNLAKILLFFHIRKRTRKSFEKKRTFLLKICASAFFFVPLRANMRFL